ncbi:hypothetical protein [Streptomyces sp. NPDC060027]|uniref:hypothetical protein n=1 Tax=Streptomyces sp. NPDC060027 TaxID=3347040 RepID=UPI0036A49086
MNEIPAKTETFETEPSRRPLPPLRKGYCPWKESGPDGNRTCRFLAGHDGDCDMQPVTP